ncbi:hypothetical protein J6590_051475 [Homalodisca vitripennis]|nr:hypothetical protein J6590_051475 [Homalodisca vitripennis]
MPNHEPRLMERVPIVLAKLGLRELPFHSELSVVDAAVVAEAVHRSSSLLVGRPLQPATRVPCQPPLQLHSTYSKLSVVKGEKYRCHNRTLGVTTIHPNLFHLPGVLCSSNLAPPPKSEVLVTPLVTLVFIKTGFAFRVVLRVMYKEAVAGAIRLVTDVAPELTSLLAMDVLDVTEKCGSTGKQPTAVTAAHSPTWADTPGVRKKLVQFPVEILGNETWLKELCDTLGINHERKE